MFRVLLLGGTGRSQWAVAQIGPPAGEGWVCQCQPLNEHYSTPSLLSFQPCEHQGESARVVQYPQVSNLPDLQHTQSAPGERGQTAISLGNTHSNHSLLANSNTYSTPHSHLTLHYSATSLAPLLRDKSCIAPRCSDYSLHLIRLRMSQKVGCTPGLTHYRGFVILFVMFLCQTLRFLIVNETYVRLTETGTVVLCSQFNVLQESEIYVLLSH
eukprot:sb/3470105/